MAYWIAYLSNFLYLLFALGVPGEEDSKSLGRDDSTLLGRDDTCPHPPPLDTRPIDSFLTIDGFGGVWMDGYCGGFKFALDFFGQFQTLSQHLPWMLVSQICSTSGVLCRSKG